MTKTDIKNRISELRKELSQISWKSKKHRSIMGKIGALKRKLDPDYIKKQSLAAKKRWG